jgi:two-component system chemotaxis response regulator CheY
MKTDIEVEPRNKNASSSRRSRPAQIRALVVEDDPAMSSLIKVALEAAEIEHVILVSSANAVARFQHEKFDVILVDVSGPPGHGGMLAREIRKSGFNRNTPIITMSDDQRPGALSESFEAGASFFVYKPLDKARLMRLIRVTQGTIEYEKRRFRRVPVRAAVRVRCAGTSTEGETIDLSLNGALIRTPTVFALGSRVEVIVDLYPGGDPVVGKGIVTRVAEGNQMGIQFHGLTVAASGRLQDYLLPLIAE